MAIILDLRLKNINKRHPTIEFVWDSAFKKKMDSRLPSAGLTISDYAIYTL